jgi:hypothetical protein
MKPTTIASRLRHGFGGQALPASAGIPVITLNF